MIVHLNLADRLRSGNLRADVLASLVVFVVALPLCVGIALASGFPPAAGLITGIVGGLIVAPLAGAPLQISGPDAGLAVLTYELVELHGMSAFTYIVILAGIMQCLAGWGRLAQWFRAVSPAVIQGMLAGIGVLIIVGQLQVMVGERPLPSGWANVLALPQALVKGLLSEDTTSHYWSARIGILTLLIMATWKGVVSKWFRGVPAPLVAVGVATVATQFAGLDVPMLKLGSMTEAIRLPEFAAWTSIFNWTLLGDALGLAILASAETLLCAAALDKLHSYPEARTRYDKELFAQGIGNTLCGFVGGLPLAGVIVRSVANVDAGGRTRLAAVLHGAWLLLLVVSFPRVLELLPLSSLAAVLVFTGCKMLSPRVFRELWRVGWSEAAIYCITAAVVVWEDVLSGVIAGVVLSALKLFWEFSHLRVEVRPGLRPDQVRLKLRGAATFVRLPRIATALEAIPPSSELHVDLEHLTYVDHACLDLLVSWQQSHENTGGKLIMDWGKLHARFRANAPPAVETAA